MSDEWTIERLNLGAYLRRIRCDAGTAPTSQTLARLQRAHVAAIPFENLDIPLGRGIAVDLDSIQDKLVARRRGGYCYEHGLLFAAALERLGYSVDRLLARVGDDGERPRARTHLTLRVRAGTGSWLVNVGFGSGPLEPLSFDAGGAQTQDGWTYALATTAAHSWHLRERQGADWVTLYSVEDHPVHDADIVMANYFTSTYPRSGFVGQSVVIRRDADSIRRLTGRRFSVTRPGYAISEQQLSDAAFADALYTIFGLSLSPDEVTRLVAALPPNTEA